MSILLPRDIDLDELMQLLHRPVEYDAGQLAYGLDLMQRYASENYSGSLASLIETSAVLNDIGALTKVIASGELHTAIDNNDDVPRIAEMVSSVAHMLVNGSDHESFAREWLHEFDPQGKHVRLHLDVLCRNTSRSTIDSQRLLGLTQLTDFFACRDSNDTLPWASLAAAVFDRDSYRTQNQILGVILREQYPDGPPSVQSHKILRTQSSLIDALWTGNPDSLGFLLPSIEMAYGKNVPQITESMRAGCARFIEEGRLKVERPSDHYDPRWEAIGQWADTQVATSILGATTLSDGPFAYALARLPFDEAKDRLDQLQALGVDILQICHHGKTHGQVAGNYLLDAAVFEGKAPLTGYLLALGADPLASSNREGDGIQVKNALELAEDMVRRFPENVDADGFDAVLHMLRSVTASRAAQDALAELGLTTSRSIQP